MFRRDDRFWIHLLAGVVVLLSSGLVWQGWKFRESPGSNQTAADHGQETAETPKVVTLYRTERSQSAASTLETSSAEISDRDRLVSSLSGAGVVPGEAVLAFDSLSALERFLEGKDAGLEVLWADGRLLSARIHFSDLDALSEALGGIRDDVRVHPTYVARIPGLPQEEPAAVDETNAGGRAPFRESLMGAIGADQNRETWGSGVTVALLDSGVDAHSSLEGVGIQAVELIDGDLSHGHGTAMASLIAGRVFPAEGVAPASRILDVRVADAEGASNTGLIAQGVMEAVDHGADVINISLGASGDSLLLRNAIGHALEARVLVVAAAGNDQLTRLAYPAAYPGVIAVGAVDRNNEQAWFSNSGENLTLAAPGVGVYSAYLDDKLAIGSGSSQSAALTSGAVSAMMSWGYAPSDIVSVLIRHAVSTGAPQEQIGAGVLRLPER